MTNHVAELFDAIAKRDSERATKLIDSYPLAAGARNQRGVSALMLARYSNLRPVTEALLQKNPDLDVFEAATFGRATRLRELLSGDASLATARSADGGTALHFACFFAQPECAKDLIARGADVNAVAAGFGNACPLHSAASGRNLEIVRMLLEAGAEPNRKQDHGWTALHSAAHNGDVEMIRLLLKHEADPRAAADNGQTAVDLAKEHPEAVEVLRAAMQ